MTDHVAVLRRMREWTCWERSERAVFDHAIAAVAERDALVARLGELEKAWRNKQPLLGACRATADYQQVADDLARVVAGNGGGDG